MAAAARIHGIERGRDLRQYPLFAFGGAGPVHCWQVAKILKVPRILIPFGAGAMSAYGLLAAPLAFDFVRTGQERLDRADWPAINRRFAEMEEEGRALLARAGGVRWAGWCGGGVRGAGSRRRWPDTGTKWLRTWCQPAESDSQGLLRRGGRLRGDAGLQPLRSRSGRRVHRTRDRRGARIDGRRRPRRALPRGRRTGPDRGDAIMTQMRPEERSRAPPPLRPPPQCSGPPAPAMMDPVTLEICWSRLIGVVNEQAAALQRTSFTSIVREAGDLSAGVFDRRGYMVAPAGAGTPGHINSMALPMKHLLAACPPETLPPGGGPVTNDPPLPSPPP